MYPLPTPIDIRKPEYKFVPEYSCVQIDDKGLFASLSPEAKSALIIGMGALAIGIVAFMLKKQRETIKELTKKPKPKKLNVSATRTNKRTKQ